MASMLARVRRRTLKWCVENALGLVTALVGVIAVRQDLGEFLERYTGTVLATIAMFAVVCVLGYSLGKVFRWLWGAARRVVWMSYRRHVLRLTDVDARTKRLETVNSDLEERCGVLEERLMVRRLPILNLPDFLPPESISAAVRQYERQHGYRDLWQAVERCLLMSSDGYVVIDHKEGGGGVGSTGSQYYPTRRQAESGLGRSSGGMLLVHAIASDWVAKGDRMVTLDVGGGPDPLENPHRERHPRFMSVDQSPDGSYIFRFEAQEDGRDDSTGRTFDWWFEQLKNALEGTHVRVQDNCVRENEHSQVQYLGILRGNGGTAVHRHQSNRALIEFTLHEVTVTRTCSG